MYFFLEIFAQNLVSSAVSKEFGLYTVSVVSGIVTWSIYSCWKNTAWIIHYVCVSYVVCISRRLSPTICQLYMEDYVLSPAIFDSFLPIVTKSEKVKKIAVGGYVGSLSVCACVCGCVSAPHSRPAHTQ